MIIFSDLFGDRDALCKGLQVLRQRGHDVAICHILDDDEIDFPFDGPTRFEGLEMQAEKSVAIHVLYEMDILKQWKNFLQKCEIVRLPLSATINSQEQVRRWIKLLLISLSRRSKTRSEDHKFRFSHIPRFSTVKKSHTDANI